MKRINHCSILLENTHDTGISSNAHCGKNGIAKNFKPTKNDGANNSFPMSRNSLFSFLLKHSESMLNVHFTTFCVVNRFES